MRKEKVFYGWWVVAGCFVITCTVIPLLMALFNKFLLQVTQEMAISRSSFTLSHGITQALGIFFSPFVARALNKGNFRLKMSINLTGFCLAYASYALAQNVYHLYISSFFVGVFFLGVALIPLSMMITNWFVTQRGLALSIVMSGIGLGGFMFSPLVTYFLTHYGWRMTYCLMALIVLSLALPVCIFVLRKKPEDMGLRPYGADGAPGGAQGKRQVAAVALPVKASYATMFFWLLMLGTVTNGLINTGALGQYPPALEEKFGPLFQATIISLYSMFGIFGKLLLGWINDRWGVVVSSTFGCVTFGSTFILMLLGRTEGAMYLMALLFGMGMAIGSVSLPLITSAIYGSEKYGEAYGVVNSAYQIGLSCGSILVAGIFDITGSYSSAWVLMAVLTAVTLLSWVAAYTMSRRYCTVPGQEYQPAADQAGAEA